MTIARRSFITGLAALITAPAIVRAGSLMPVRVVKVDVLFQEGDLLYNGVIIRKVDVAWGVMRRRWITWDEAIKRWPDAQPGPDMVLA